MRENVVAETAATTQFDHGGNPVPPPQAQVQQPVVVQQQPPVPSGSLFFIDYQIKQSTYVAPTYVRLPNGQLQLIQTVQQPAQQTIYVPPPLPILPAKTNEQNMHSFAVAQTLGIKNIKIKVSKLISVMMTNIVFSGICVGYVGFGLDQCKTYYNNM